MSELPVYHMIKKRSPRIEICFTDPIKKSHGVYVGRLYDSTEEERGVAIKRLEPLERNKKEVEIMLRLPAHKNIVQYIESVESESDPPDWYLVMELCQKNNLSTFVQQSNLTFKTKRVILLQIAEGLAHLHRNNVIHRDLKPHNMLLSADGCYIKICDFGLSKCVADTDLSHTKSSSIIGTMGWGSPESYDEKKKFSAKSDVFSAGLVLFFVVTDGAHACGNDPHQWTSRIKDEKPIDIDKLTLECDELDGLLLRQLICQMVSKDPNQRPTAEEVLQHPFFWDNKKRAQFLHFIAEKIAPRDSNITCAVSLSASWKHSLKNAGIDEAVVLFHEANDLESKDLGQPPLVVFLHLLRNSYDRATQGSDESYSIFFDKLWPLFSSKYPETICDIFGWVLKNIEKDVITEDFAAIEEYPKATKLTPVPGEPNDVTASLEGSNIVVKWTDDGGDDSTFWVKVKEEGLAGGVQEYEMKGSSGRLQLDPKSSTDYTFCVYGINSNGQKGKQSRPQKIRTPLRRIMQLEVKSGKDSFDVSWAKLERAKCYFVRPYRNGKICGEVGSTEDEKYVFYVSSIGGRDYSEGDQYHFEVWAEDKFKTKSLLAVSETTYLAIGPPAGARVKRKGQSLQLIWESIGKGFSYRIQVLSDQQILKTHETRELEFEYLNPLPTRTYHFKIWARNKYGVDGETVTLGPCKVGIAEVQARTALNEIIVSWTALTDDINEYQVRVLCRKDKLSYKTEEILSKTTKENTFIFDDVVRTMQYQFKISLADHDGKLGSSASSDWITADWLKVENLTLTVVAKEFLRAEWRNEKTHIYTVQVLCDGAPLEEPKEAKSGWYLFRAEKWKRYCVKVTARSSKSGRESKTACSRTTMLPPGQVQNLSSYVLDDKLHFVWDPTSGATNYSVNLFANNFSKRKNTTDAQLFFLFAFSTRYTCSVAAVNEYDEAGMEASGEICTPPPPVEITTTNYNNDKIIVKWKDLGNTVFKYFVETFRNNESQDIVERDRSTTVFELSNLQLRSRYSFKVWARNKFFVDSKAAKSIDITTHAENSPVIENLSGKYENDEVIFTWKEIGKGTKYRTKLFSKDGDQSTLIKEDEISDSRYFYPAEHSKRYHLKIQAVDANGSKTEPEESNGIYTPPAPPRITQSIGNGKELKIMWEKCRVDADITYNVQTYCNDKPENQISFGYNTTEFTLPDLQFQKRYYLDVWAVNKYGIGSEKSRSTQVVGGLPGPARVSSVCSDVTGNNVGITWRSVPEIACYLVRVCRDIPYKEVYTEETEETKARFTLEHSTQYHCYVRGKTKEGSEGEDAFCSFQTDPTLVSDIQHDFDGKQSHHKWKKIKEHARYHVQIHRILFGGETLVMDEWMQMFCCSHEIEHSTKYSLTVWAEDINKKLSKPATSIFRTPPSAVKIRKPRYQNRKIILKWESIEEPQTTYCVLPYYKHNQQEVKTLKECKFVQQNVKDPKMYHFEVWAVNKYDIPGEKTSSVGAISRAKTVEVNFKPSLAETSTVAPPPVRITRTQRRGGKIILKWEEIPEPDITYRVQPYRNEEALDTEKVSGRKFVQEYVQPTDKYKFLVWAVNRHGVEGEKKLTTLVNQRHATISNPIALFTMSKRSSSSGTLSGRGSLRPFASEDTEGSRFGSLPGRGNQRSLASEDTEESRFGSLPGLSFSSVHSQHLTHGLSQHLRSAVDAEQEITASVSSSSPTRTRKTLSSDLLNQGSTDSEYQAFEGAGTSGTLSRLKNMNW